MVPIYDAATGGVDQATLKVALRSRWGFTREVTAAPISRISGLGRKIREALRSLPLAVAVEPSDLAKRFPPKGEIPSELVNPWDGQP